MKDVYEEMRKLNKIRKTCGLEELPEENVITDEMSKKEKRDRIISVLAHLMVAQIATVEDITYAEAKGILSRAEHILENQMKNGSVVAPKEVRDKWNSVIK